MANIFPKGTNQTVIKAGIFLNVVGILVTLAVPQYNKVIKTTNQTSAVNSLKQIHSAEVQYSSAYPQNGFSCALPALGGDPSSGAPSAQSAQVLDPGLASKGFKSGYQFNVSNCTKQTVGNQDMFTGFQVTATPITPNKTGDLGYCMDENGLIKSDPAGGTNCTQSLQ